MKFIQPSTEEYNVPRSFLIYGEPKAGKTSLALSIAEGAKTLFIAAEKDGWQDVFQQLSPKAKANIIVAELQSLDDVQKPLEIPADVKVIVLDSVTSLMNFIEAEIKKTGGKNVNNGISQKLSLSAYGDLANVAISYMRRLKELGKHLIFTAGVDKEHIENAEGITTKRMPLLTGSKFGNTLPYEMRAIGYLRDVNGKRELWFQSSPQWLAGSNYPAITNAKMIADPTFLKIFGLFPKPAKKKESPKKEETKLAKPEDVHSEYPLGKVTPEAQ